MTIKSIIEDIFDSIHVHFDREAFAAEYARNLRDGTHDRTRGYRAAGLKPAGAEGYQFEDLRAQDYRPEAIVARWACATSIPS